jgi:DNA mismatch repair protein MSH4
MEGQTLRRWLKKLQDEFTLQMAAVDEDIAGFDECGIDDYHINGGPNEASNANIEHGSEYSSEQQLLEASGSEISQPPTAFVSTAEWPLTEMSSRETFGKRSREFGSPEAISCMDSE